MSVWRPKRARAAPCRAAKKMNCRRQRSLLPTPTPRPKLMQASFSSPKKALSSVSLASWGYPPVSSAAVTGRKEPGRKTAGAVCRREVFRFREEILRLCRLFFPVGRLRLCSPLRGTKVAERRSERGLLRRWRSDYCRPWSSPREGKDACRGKRKVSPRFFEVLTNGGAQKGKKTSSEDFVLISVYLAPVCSSSEMGGCLSAPATKIDASGNVVR